MRQVVARVVAQFHLNWNSAFVALLYTIVSPYNLNWHPPTPRSSPLLGRLFFCPYRWTRLTRLSTQRPRNFGMLRLACRSFIFEQGHILTPEQKTITGTHLASYGQYTSQRNRFQKKKKKKKNLAEAEKEDKELTEAWKGEADSILVFVSSNVHACLRPSPSSPKAILKDWSVFRHRRSLHHRELQEAIS